MDGQSSRPNSVPPEGSAPALRKRRRPALACENCRRRKIKCDRKTPCSKCIRGKRAQTCSYVPEGDASAVKTRPSRPSPAKQQPTPQSRDGSVTHVAASNPRTRVVEQGLLQEAVEKIGSSARSQLPVESTPLSQTHVPQPASLLGPDSDLPLRETYVKGKLFGASHWTNAVDHLPNMLRLHRYDSARYPQIRELLCQCKRYARQAKRHPPSFEATSAELRNKLPPREVADQLLNRYLDTFEAVFRLHHPPSFRQEYEEYWLNPSAARDSFVVKLLLVLALGTCFDDLDSPESWYAASLQWIVAAHAWVNSPFNKRRSSLVEVQIQCLLLLARQTHAIGGDMIWTSAGTLHRTAMQIGLNRDPSHLPVKSPVELEVRKRVWATTLELLVQSSIDAGQPPLISVDDFDCGAPSDSDDLESQNSSSADWGTQKSAQNILLDSLPVRLEIAKFLNHFRSDLSYSAALELSTRLAKSIRIQAGSFSNKSESGVFQCKLVEFLTHRFIIVLHQAFAAKAKNSPTFYFSRKMCSDASLLILTASQSGQSSNYFNKLMSLGNGIFHITFLQAAAFLVLEQTIQQDEASSYSSLVTQSSLLSQQEQRQALRFYCNSLRSKLKRGQANFKAYVFLECAVTQLEDTAGSTENERISQLEIVLRECAHILGQSVGSVGSAETSNSQGATPSQQTSDIGDFVFDMSNFPYDLEGPNAVPLPDSLFVDPMYWPFQE